MRLESFTGTQRCFWRAISEDLFADWAASSAAFSALFLMKLAAFSVTTPRMHSGSMNVIQFDEGHRTFEFLLCIAVVN